jgi:hypothetical protein
VVIFREYNGYISQGNKLADTLAKDAAADLDIAVSYDGIPKSVVKRELET